MNIPCSNPCPSCDAPAPGTRGAPNPNDPQNPLVNLSSEAPDKDNFIGQRWGVPPDGDYWPPLGRNWYSIGCTGFCVSDVSQDEANICAANQAVECTSNQWPPVVVVDPNAEPPVVDPQPGVTYYNDEQTGYFTCPDGSQTRYEIAAGSFSALSKAAADAMAYAYAVEQAALSYICFSDLTASRCCAGSSFLATVTVNTPLTVTLSVIGDLPSGLIATVEGKTITISGTPAASGQYNFRVNARENAQNSAEKFLTINVNDIANSSTLPNATPSVPYSTTLVVGGPDTGSDVTWAISGGALPSGLTLGATTGIISGTPTTAGTSIFYVRMTSGTLQCTKVFSITVATPCAFPSVFTWTDQVGPSDPSMSITLTNGSVSGTAAQVTSIFSARMTFAYAGTGFNLRFYGSKSSSGYATGGVLSLTFWDGASGTTMLGSIVVDGNTSNNFNEIFAIPALASGYCTVDLYYQSASPDTEPPFLGASMNISGTIGC